SSATASLSVPRFTYGAAASGKVLFGGGFGSSNTDMSVVDIYDTTANTWSTSSLSQGRYDIAATQWANKAFFGGGYFGNSSANNTNTVDIYTSQNYPSITSSKVFTLVDRTNVAGLMQLNSPGSLNLGGFDLSAGSLGGAAPINLGSRTLTLGGDNSSTSYAGAISGSGSVSKTGGGMLTVNGA